jgi:hypothetical protein
MQLEFRASETQRAGTTTEKVPMKISFVQRQSGGDLIA